MNNKENNVSAEKPVQIAGQAVMEGVMMRGRTSMALAVRDESGQIRLDTTRLAPASKIRKVPFIRGIVNLFISLVSGTKLLLKSAEVAGEEVDTSNGKTMGFAMAISLVLGFALAIGLFVVLPTAITEWLFDIDNRLLKLVIDGLVKVVIMLGYFIGVSYIKDIRRVFMYHGAEHKTISCCEKNLPLTVENVRTCSKHHDRCGTSFVVYVIIISMVVMILFGVLADLIGFDAYFDKTWVRSLIKIALLPLTAAISYEMIMCFSRTNFVLVRPFKWLGAQMQRITTKEPTDDMIEVAIMAHETVAEMDADETIPEQHFPEPITLEEFTEQVKPLLEYKTIESSDVEWILCSVLGLKRNQLKGNVKVPFGYQIRITEMLKKCAAGEPLQYVLGNTEFYGLLFYVSPDCLIPRMETELVCEQAINLCEGGGKKVLDLCCGSGCIGITIAAKTKSNQVTCSDISRPALKIAKANAALNNVVVNFMHSDLFDKFNSKFDVIVCNPPYIATKEIDELDVKVKDHEPRIALDGGEDGLDYYRKIADQAPKYLYDDGKLVFEIGYDQHNRVRDILEKNFNIIKTMKDYGGKDRIIIAQVK